MKFFEKVNPSHPDKIADRIAGALSDLYYNKNKNNKFAIEVLIGHGKCLIISEASDVLDFKDVVSAVRRITKNKHIKIHFKQVKQDKHLFKNQKNEIRCGDNGIFKSVPYKDDLIKEITDICYEYYKLGNMKDGKVVGNERDITVCQSNYNGKPLSDKIKINPLGFWTGGLNVDSGATNRKLGSDMGDAVSGGGLWGKDLSKADITINTYLYLLSQKNNRYYNAICSIGDSDIFIYERYVPTFYMKIKYSEMVEDVRRYIESLGGFEKFAEWGFIRPSNV